MRTNGYNEFGQEERYVEVCNYCGEEVKSMGDDGISVCNEGGCGIVEGETKYITEEEFENR